MSTLFPSQERTISSKLLLLLAVVIAAFSSTALSQSDDWKGGNGNWSNASMWSFGVPGASSNVFIDNSNPLASLVTLDQSDTINTLTIDADDKLSFNLNTQLTVNGRSISNAGQITINGGSATNSELTLGASTTLSGGGKVILSSTTAGGGVAFIQGNSSTLTNTNNTIQGDGVIGNGSLALVNQSGGTIDANSAGGSFDVGLTLNGSGGVTNAGLLEATNKGVLSIQNTVNNSGGNITANGSGATVQLIGADIQGGTLNTVSGGTFITPNGNSSTLDGATKGALTLSSGSTYTGDLNSNTQIVGTINNNGNFQINGGSATNSELTLIGSTTLQGSGGKVTLSSITSGGGVAFVQGNGQTLTNTNNIIQGAGVIGNGSLTLINQVGGTINASGAGTGFDVGLTLNGSGGVTNAGLLEATNNGVLSIQNTVNNSGGKITANGSNATVQLNGADIQGGTLNTVSGGTLITRNGNSATLDGKTHGSLTLSKGSTYTGDFNTNTQILGTINNNGNFQINGGSATNSELSLVGNTTLQGTGGTVTLNTITSGGGAVFVQGNGFTLTNSSDTIQGAGVIGNGSLSLINNSGGTIFANVSGQGLLLNGSGKITNNGTFKVAAGSTLQVENGTFTNFAGTTLTGGTYNTAGALQINELGTSGGEIVTNAANIILSGTSSVFEDANGNNALSAFNTNASTGSFTINNGRNFTTAGNFTNNGTLTVGSGSKVDVNGNLTNFAGTTLTGGTYNITGTLQFKGANIVTNAANITLSGTSSAIVNQSAVNALANFASNASGGAFSLAGNRNFTTAGNFGNAGTLNIASGTAFTVGGTGLFTQTAGLTKDDGTLTDSGGLDLNGGSLIGKGTVSGAIDNAGGTIDPGDTATSAGILTDKGAYTQGASGKLDIAIGGTTAGTQYDELNATTVNLSGGTLNVSLTNGFVPKVGQIFKIMNFNSETGTGFSTCSCAINSTEHFVVTVQGSDVLLSVVSGAAASVTPVSLSRSGSQLAASSLRTFGNSIPLPWNSLARKLNRGNGYVMLPRPGGLEAGLVIGQLPLHTLSPPARSAVGVLSGVRVSPFSKVLPQLPAIVSFTDSHTNSNSNLRFRPTTENIFASSFKAARSALASPTMSLNGLLFSALKATSDGKAFDPLVGGLEGASAVERLQTFVNKAGTAANLVRGFSTFSVPPSFTGRLAGASFARGTLGSAQWQMRFNTSNLNKPRPRLGPSSFKSRTVVGGLSWGLSSLLAKPKFGLAIQ